MGQTSSTSAEKSQIIELRLTTSKPTDVIFQCGTWIILISSKNNHARVGFDINILSSTKNKTQRFIFSPMTKMNNILGTNFFFAGDLPW